ncbi:hypothetical protein ACWCPD_16120 [Streptomyces sp. NPDC001935]
MTETNPKAASLQSRIYDSLIAFNSAACWQVLQLAQMRQYLAEHLAADLAAPTVPAAAPTGDTTLRDRVARAIHANRFPDSRWDDLPETLRDDYRSVADAVLAVLRAPADRAALAAHLWAVAEHHIVAEWICCEPINPEHDLCVQGDATRQMVKALLVDDPEAIRPAPLLDAVLAAGLPAPVDRPAILRAEAEHLIRDLFPAVYEDAGYQTALGVNRAAMELLDRATADELRAKVAAAVSGPGRVADETQADFQDRGDAARRAAGIDGTAGDAQDVPHAFVLDEPTDGCLLCGLSPTYRKHQPAVVSQPDGEA